MEVREHTFLVAGGGSGLGAATAHSLAREGANVVVADLEGEAEGENVRFVETDVTGEGSVKGAIDAALRGFGGLHGAVNCAGTASAEKVLGRKGPHSLESFSKVVEVNLVGTFNSHHREPDAQRRGHPSRRRHKARPALTGTSSSPVSSAVSLLVAVSQEVRRDRLRVTLSAPRGLRRRSSADGCRPWG